MEEIQPQKIFFSHIKSRLPAHLSLVDEIAELLQISNDSAYRRIRGEKPISLDEMQVLCRKFNLSLDQLLQLKSSTIMFTGNLVDSSTFNLTQYLKDINGNLEMIASLPGSQFYFFNKDIPIFHFMAFPELSAFKFFFWKRTILNYPELAKAQFLGHEDDEENNESGRKIISNYNKINSTEIWNEESLNATIRQIEFYRHTNAFSEKSILRKVYDQMEELVSHLEAQAATGMKFKVGSKPAADAGSNSLYINECLIGDNTIYVGAGETQVSFVNHGGLNFMATQDKRFCDYTYQNLQNIIRKSTHISVVGEKERSIFFNMMKEKIWEKKKSV